MSEPKDKLELDGDSAAIEGQARGEAAEIERGKVAELGLSGVWRWRS